jgi:hypothetical protein
MEHLNTWINDFKNNIINDNVLLLVFRDSNYGNKIINMKWVEEVLFKDMNNEYYQLSNMNELDNIDELQDYKGKKNLIVLGYMGMSIDKIANTNFKILLYFNPVEYFVKFKTFLNSLVFNYIKNPYAIVDVIEKKEPLDIIVYNSSVEINYFLSILFFPYIFNKNFLLFQSIDILKSNRRTYLYLDYLDTLKYDVDLLIQKRKLTARLAIAIYKISTLKFHENHTVIGTFFRKELDIKSKTFKLPYKIYPQIVKIYDLYDSPNEKIKEKIKE